jgi:two-component system NarL family sensor kinase
MQNSGMEVTFIFVMGTVIVVVAFVFILSFVILYDRRRHRYHMNLQDMERENQRRMLEAVITTQEKEKEYFAIELHDSLGQLLTTVKMKLNTIAPKAGIGLAADIAELTQLTQDSITEARAISHKLMPDVLTSFGLKQAVSDVLKSVNRSGPAKATLDYACHKRYPAEVERSLFRISQELVNNTMKYAGATLVNISLREEGNELEFIYTDNGKGMDLDESRLKGLGLLSIESRVSYLKGSAQFTSGKDQGVKFVIRVPVA